MPYADVEAKRAYQRQWLAKRRAEWLADKSCAVCGATEDLEVDHIDPSLKVSHNLWSWSAARREAELAKCQVLCGDHHREKTQAWYAERAEHGTGMYRKGCRCAVCRGAIAAYARERRAG